MDTSESLQYFISQRNGIVVIGFSGTLDRKSNLIIDKCVGEIAATKPRGVVISLRDVGDQFNFEAVYSLAKLQKGVRDLAAGLRLCDLHPELEKLMNVHGILRSSEVAADLATALVSIAKAG